MNRRSLLRSALAFVGAVAVAGWNAGPVQAAYYFFYSYRFSHYTHRCRRRSRWARRR